MRTFYRLIPDYSKFISVFLLLCLFGFSNPISAQSLYEITFKAADVKYTGFLVYFNEQDAYMRVGYTYQNKYNVVNVKYQSIIEEEDGYNYFIMVGSEPTFITAATKGAVYNPDHFIWMWNEEESHSEPYVTDDPHFNEENILLADSYREITASELNQTYLRQFFGSEETQYKALLRMNAANTNTQTTTNTNTSTQTDASKSTLHLLMVVNTEIPDIGQSCAVDQRTIETEFREISKAVGMPFKKYTVNGESFTKANVEKALKEMSVGSSDVVVFYYSGHGYRFSDQTDQYPQLDMRYSEYTQLSENTTLSLSQVYNSIVGKGGRLNLVMSDCCNSDVGRNQFTSTTFMASRSFQGAEISKLKKLFLDSNGTLIFTGSSPGQYAWCNSNGGFFTLSFLQSLKEEIGYMRTEAPSWQKIIQNTNKNTNYKIKNCNGCQTQTPLHYIKISQK